MAQSRKKRSYSSDLRRAQADKTRQSLVAAARKLLMSRRGIEHFSLEAVAQRAKVTRLTIYNQFGSRLGLLEAVYDDLAARGRIAEHMATAFRQPDPVACLDGVVDAFADFWNAQRTVLRRLRCMAALDPAFDGVRQRDARRHAAMRVIAQRLDAAGVRAATVTETDVNLLTVLTGFEMFDALAAKEPDQDKAKAVLRGLVRAALGLVSGEPATRNAAV